MSRIRRRMFSLLEQQEVEKEDPSLLDFAQRIALAADSLGITDVGELADILKKLATSKVAVLKKAVNQMSRSAKEKAIYKAMKAATMD